MSVTAFKSRLWALQVAVGTGGGLYQRLTVPGMAACDAQACQKFLSIKGLITLEQTDVVAAERSQFIDVMSCVMLTDCDM